MTRLRVGFLAIVAMGAAMALAFLAPAQQPKSGLRERTKGNAEPKVGSEENKRAASPRAPAATPAEALKAKKDFKVELLYSVPKETEGSWVNMCVDPKGRLIVSDQYGPLYRVTPSPLGGRGEATKIERIDLPLGGAHGLLWAFDSLYVMVNEDVTIGGKKPRRGLYRVRSSDGGDTFEKPQLLRA